MRVGHKKKDDVGVKRRTWVRGREASPEKGEEKWWEGNVRILPSWLGSEVLLKRAG